MLLFFLLLYLPIVFCSFLDLSKINQKCKYILFGIICVYVLSLSLFLVTKSGDFVNYKLYFENTPSLYNLFSFNYNEIAQRYEPGYALLNIIIKTFINQPIIALSVITIIGLIGILYQLPKYTTGIFLALSIYIAHFYWWNGIVLLRQVYAIICVFPTLYLITQKKYNRTILLILLAAMFHYSALIFLVVFPLLFRNYSTKSIIIFCLACFMFGYFDILIYLVRLFVMLIPRGEVFVNYLLSQNRPLNILYYLETVLVLSIALFYRAKLHNVSKYSGLAINFLTIGVCIAGVLQNFEIASRLSSYFIFFAYLVLLPAFANLFSLLRNRICYYLALNFYMLVYLIRFVNVTLY